MHHTYRWVAASILAGVASASGGGPAAAPPPRPVSVAELVKRLASDDDRTWRQASEQLANLDVPPSELVKAKSDANPAVRERATNALRAVDIRVTDRKLSRGRRFIERGEVDLFVASTATWDLEAEDERLWNPLFEFAPILAKKATYDWPLRSAREAFTDVASFRRKVSPRFIRTDGVYRRPAKDVKGNPIFYRAEALMSQGVASPYAIGTSLVVSRGDVSAHTAIDLSVILCNGEVKVGTHVSTAIIICDGDVIVEDRVLRSLIVARGNITAKGIVSDSILRAGGKLNLAKGVELTPEQENVIKESTRDKEPNAFKFITFFELSRVGVEVAEKDKAVRVAKLTDTSPLRKAGVAVGDAVTKVNGLAVATAEELRRALRDATATKGEATLTVVRAGKATDIRVPLPD